MKIGFNVPKQYTQREIRELHPVDPAQPAKELTDTKGADVASRARSSLAVFLTWGSDVDADLTALADGRKPGGRVWLAAPVNDLAQLQDEKKHVREDGTRLSDRDVVQMNANHNRFYLPPFPSDPAGHLGRYIDFKKIAPVGVQVFIDGKSSRIAGLTEDALNDFFHHLCWHFTRAEIFFHPVRCIHCGELTPLDITFEGQKIEDDPL
ncbi:MAG TPA: hypothetical protein VKW06_08890 [Candidatus Angelobacter sp.]|nr:hypothetical protein [Candidatus Angelobacter sp.]